ncbi:MAG TPA: hypothetical protein VIK91_10950 [Nannocystis sp.]
MDRGVAAGLLLWMAACPGGDEGTSATTRASADTRASSGPGETGSSTGSTGEPTTGPGSTGSATGTTAVTSATTGEPTTGAPTTGAPGTTDASESEGTTGSSPPTTVQVSAGGSHTCALSDTGRVRCWGHGLHTGHGNTEVIGDDEPASAAEDVDVGGPVIKLAAGTSHTCALLAGGTVRCWGQNTYGELGYGHTERIGDDETPASAGDVDVGGHVIDVSAGENITCAVLDGGNVRCWGRGIYGALGRGNTDNVGDDETPASVGDVDLGATASAIAAGGSFTCALVTGQAAKCWGAGGMIGAGNLDKIGDDETPAAIGPVEVGGAVEVIEAGYQSTCALLVGGALRCWGSGGSGALGYGHVKDIGDDESPASAGDVSVGEAVVAATVGTRFSCALLASGSVRCWGENTYGQLGLGHTTAIGDDELPSSAPVVDLGGAVTAIDAGYFHACALLTSGAVRCWGDAQHGQLGLGSKERVGDDESPGSVGEVPIW